MTIQLNDINDISKEMTVQDNMSTKDPAFILIDYEDYPTSYDYGYDYIHYRHDDYGYDTKEEALEEIQTELDEIKIDLLRTRRSILEAYDEELGMLEEEIEDEEEIEENIATMSNVEVVGDGDGSNKWHFNGG